MSLIGREIYRDVPLPTPVAATPESCVRDREPDVPPPAFRPPVHEPVAVLRRSS